MDSCLENSTFLAGEQKTAADILLFHGSVHESVSKTLNCVSMTDFKWMFQNSWCCVETGLPREREVHSPEQVNHEKNCDLTILKRIKKIFSVTAGGSDLYSRIPS